MPTDRDTFRRLMSAFPTGVTIVTTLDSEGRPKGLTIQAFLAVSIEPPLLLISIDRASRTLDPLSDHGAFVVNFLAAGREQVSNTFASKEEDKFADVTWRPSQFARGAPVLADDVVAYAECLITQEIDAGDHRLFIASVEGGEAYDRIPLLYYRRNYSEWAREIVVTAPASPDAWPSYTE